MLARQFVILWMLSLSCTHGVLRGEDQKPTDKPRSCIPTEKDPKRHEQFLKDKAALLEKGPIELVFIGDSITDGWRWPGWGKAVWAKHYAKYNALNLGIGGDHTEHVLWRVEHGELDGISPKVLVMMVGTNNGQLPVSEIVAGIHADVDLIHEKLPVARILLLAIFPRSPKATDPIRANLRKVNEDISKLNGTKNVTYLDIGDKFLDKDGNLSQEIMPDYLHPHEKGYEIWAEAIGPTLDGLMK